MRSDWAELPVGARDAVLERTGPVAEVQDVPHGITCSFAAVLSTAAVRVFVKGVPVGDERGRAAQAWEVAVNPLVLQAGPRLLWQLEAEGWDLLGFEWVNGRHADLSPGSLHLPLVAAALGAAQGVVAPAEVPQFVDRDLAEFVTAEERELLLGDALLHTDTNPHNLLVDAGRAWLVDWAMPARGPAWVDVAEAAVRLLEAGCRTDEALAWAAGFESWRSADRAAVEVFVGATCRAWAARVGTRGARPSNARFEALLTAG
ncbi:aminoglycoside phosphotransferase [Streptomyces cinnamoneus]|uniref:aminoglycoside phosphotransferase n=1 Tax=Streptomyces cinnamoneus TaxID=53446 RepID=UPI00341FA73E